MEYDETIKEQLENYIKEPAILMSKDNIPYEYKKEGSINRLKRRRSEDIEIPLQLYSFLVSNNVSINQFREFASGLFLNYIEMDSIYF